VRVPDAPKEEPPITCPAIFANSLPSRALIRGPRAVRVGSLTASCVVDVQGALVSSVEMRMHWLPVRGGRGGWPIPC
jgi:hypothetical protein